MDVQATFINFHTENCSGMLRRAAISIKGASSIRRQPVHIIFVIDTSDSMNDNGSRVSGISKLDQVNKSIEFLLPLLTPSDFVSMISFGDESTVLCQGVAVTDEGRSLIQTKLRRLRTDGCTNMSAGLLDIHDILEQTNLTTLKQGVLLLTDGHANVGVTNVVGLQAIVHQLVNINPSLTLTTIGYGQDHNAELMRSMAIAGSGSYNVVYNLEGIATTFGDVLGGLTTVVAQNVAIQLPYGTIVHSGYTSTNTSSHVTVKLGDVYAENEIIVICDVPSVHTITVKGVDMRSLERITISPIVTNAPEETPQNIQLAYFRYKVSCILNEAAAENLMSDTLKQKAQDLLDELRLLSYGSDVLVQMMIDDLEQLVRVRRVDTTNVAQHSAYLSLGRGLRSEIPQEEDPFGPVHSARPHFTSPAFRPSTPPLTQQDDFTGLNEQEDTSPTPVRRTFSSIQSPFSNRVQHRNTITMRTSSQQEH
jgi:Mg-chelatase subunit ChlD